MNKMRGKTILLFVILLVCLTSFAYADNQTAIAGGGDSQLFIGFLGNLENSFFGLQPQPAPTPTPTPTPTPSPSPGGVTAAPNVTVTPSSFNVSLAVNMSTTRTLTITNVGNANSTLAISQTGLDGHVFFSNNSVTVAGGDTQTVTVTFVAGGNVGEFKGNITIGSATIPVIFTVTKYQLLYDVEINVLNPGAIVQSNGVLKTRVTMIPMGDKKRMDVTLDYAITGSDGRIYLQKSEVVLVQNQRSILDNFQLGAMPAGNYTVSVKLIYPGGVAPASARFRVINNYASEFLYYAISGLLISSLIVVIALIAIVSRDRRRKKKTPGKGSNLPGYMIQ